MAIGTDNTVLKKLLRSNECEFVSLGYNCDVAQLLRYSGLRSKAYPFDWCITPIGSVIRLFENDFHGFLDMTSLTFSAPHRALCFEGNGKSIIESDEIVVTASCSKYSMIFPHDFPNSSSKAHDNVIIKYENRIERLIRLLNSNKVVIFVINYNDEDECKVKLLKRILIVKFPNLKFQIYSYKTFRCGVKKSLFRSVFVFFNRKKQRLIKMVSKA